VVSLAGVWFTQGIAGTQGLGFILGSGEGALPARREQEPQGRNQMGRNQVGRVSAPPARAFC
jgi:hypothetical protein